MAKIQTINRLINVEETKESIDISILSGSFTFIVLTEKEFYFDEMRGDMESKRKITIGTNHIIEVY